MNEFDMIDYDAIDVNVLVDRMADYMDTNIDAELALYFRPVQGEAA